jgi:hypothetical protein
MRQEQYNKSKYKAEFGELVATAEAIRTDARMPVDISLGEVFKRKTGLEAQALYDDLGIEPNIDTIKNILTLPDQAVRFIIPEIFRDMITLGLRNSPIYPNIISGEEAIANLNVQMPYLNMSDATPKFVNEGETIQFGNISYGSKEFKVRKMGRGIALTDEVQQYSTLKVLSIFLRDFGVKLGYGLDSMAIDIALNGEQKDGSASAPVIGVRTVGVLAYRDLMRIWIRLSRMGRTANTMLAGETMAEEIMSLPEYTDRQNSGPTQATLNVKTPIPRDASLFIHGSIPEDQVIIMDPATCLIKFNAQPLKVESERIVSNQTEASYASLTTGFATVFRESRIVLDLDLPFATNGFPDYMNMDLMEVETIK